MSKDAFLIPKGVERCSLKKFSLWVLFLLAVMGWGAFATFMIFWKALNLTGMNNYFGFGAWIAFDLAVIALGAGAFFSGFLRYIIGKKELDAIICLAVILGWCCYLSAQLILGLDVGQPLRGWFIFWHANTHSMLTEVAFCITLYFMVLCIEYLPIILSNPKLDEIREVHVFGHNLHLNMAIFAAAGTFLSFFHQGSLGGMWGVLFTRPFAERPDVYVWPTTFFIFILSSIASGPALTTIVCWIVQKASGRQLFRREVLSLMGKIVGYLLTFYMVVKIIDTIYWAKVVAPAKGMTLSDMYGGSYGIWLLWAEIGICGIIPAIILLIPKLRDRDFWLIGACILDCIGIVINRFVFTVQTLAIPVLPFDKWFTYIPTWYEWAPMFMMIAFTALVISLSYRYLPIFPQERELNP